MPSKKRKYNARFPAGRIKKIMQTDEEVGKVAQAVPIIISVPVARRTRVLEDKLRNQSAGSVASIKDKPSPLIGCAVYHRKHACVMLPELPQFLEEPANVTARTLELFVESLLSKAMQVTVSRNAKTLSPSHVKQCILQEARFDFLRDLVKNIPDVSAAEEKEMMSAENSPNSSRFSEMPAPRRVAREDSNSSNSTELRTQNTSASEPRLPRTETVTSTIVSGEEAIDLSKKTTDTDSKVRTVNFYQETLTDEIQHRSVITINPTYATPQPSTSTYTILKPVNHLQRVQVPLPQTPDRPFFDPGLLPLNNNVAMPKTPLTPVAPILNIDFSKSLEMPEIKVLDSTVAGVVGAVKAQVKTPAPVQRQNSKSHKNVESRKLESRPSVSPALITVDHLNSGNLQIDEDYDT